MNFIKNGIWAILRYAGNVDETSRFGHHDERWIKHSTKSLEFDQSDQVVSVHGGRHGGCLVEQTTLKGQPAGILIERLIGSCVLVGRK